MTALATTQAHPSPPLGEALVIRPAGKCDEARLVRLAQLDSARVPAGRLLLAELGDEVLAAVAPDGAAIANPFHRTAELVELLRLRSHQASLAHQREEGRGRLRSHQSRSRWGYSAA